MCKIMLLIVPEKEQNFADIQGYLQSEINNTEIRFEQDMALYFPNLEIDLYYREVRLNGKVVRLTDLEFRLLHYLASQPSRVFTYQQICEVVWGEEYAHEKGTIMSHICHIRQKLESEGGSSDYIGKHQGSWIPIQETNDRQFLGLPVIVPSCQEDSLH